MRSTSMRLLMVAGGFLLSYCAVIDTMQSQKRLAAGPSMNFASIGPVSTSTSAGDPPAEQKFKNIQVLRGLPSSQLYPVMALMSNSLGVTCSHCHTQFFQEESRHEKQIARQMIRMTTEINRSQFQAQPTVTCYTCHNGKSYPASVPQIAQAGWQRMVAARGPVAPTPDLDDVLTLYRSAHGTQPVLPAGRGDVSLVGGLDQRLTGTFDITRDRELSLKSDIQLPPPLTAALARYGRGQLDLRNLFDDLEVVGTETVNGAPAVIVSAQKGDDVPERFAFDRATGRLLRIHRSVSTDLGHFPEEIWFEDYRPAGGGLAPGTVRWARGDYLVTFRFADGG